MRLDWGRGAREAALGERFGDFEDLWTRSTQIVKFPINRFLPHKFPEGSLPQKITVWGWFWVRS